MNTLPSNRPFYSPNPMEDPPHQSYHSQGIHQNAVVPSMMNNNYINHRTMKPQVHYSQYMQQSQGMDQSMMDLTIMNNNNLPTVGPQVNCNCNQCLQQQQGMDQNTMNGYYNQRPTEQYNNLYHYTHQQHQIMLKNMNDGYYGTVVKPTLPIQPHNSIGMDQSMVDPTMTNHNNLSTLKPQEGYNPYMHQPQGTDQNKKNSYHNQGSTEQYNNGYRCTQQQQQIMPENVKNGYYQTVAQPILPTQPSNSTGMDQSLVDPTMTNDNSLPTLKPQKSDNQYRHQPQGTDQNKRNGYRNQGSTEQYNNGYHCTQHQQQINMKNNCYPKVVQPALPTQPRNSTGMDQSMVDPTMTSDNSLPTLKPQESHNQYMHQPQGTNHNKMNGYQNQGPTEQYNNGYRCTQQQQQINIKNSCYPKVVQPALPTQPHNSTGMGQSMVDPNNKLMHTNYNQQQTCIQYGSSNQQLQPRPNPEMSQRLYPMAPQLSLSQLQFLKKEQQINKELAAWYQTNKKPKQENIAAKAKELGCSQNKVKDWIKNQRRIARQKENKVHIPGKPYSRETTAILSKRLSGIDQISVIGEKEINKLAEKAGLTTLQVRVWFNNQKQKTRKQKKREELKKKNESENRRDESEIEEWDYQKF